MTRGPTTTRITRITSPTDVTERLTPDDVTASVSVNQHKRYLAIKVHVYFNSTGILKIELKMSLMASVLNLTLTVIRMLLEHNSIVKYRFIYSLLVKGMNCYTCKHAVLIDWCQHE